MEQVKERKNRLLGVRVAVETADAIRAAARANHRGVGQQLDVIVQEWLTVRKEIS